MLHMVVYKKVIKFITIISIAKFHSLRYALNKLIINRLVISQMYNKVTHINFGYTKFP